MKRYNKTTSGVIHSRYSNLVPGNYQIGGSWNSYGGTSGLLGNGSGSGSSGGWTSQNTVDVINTGASTLTTILTSIFGRNNINQANYTNELDKQEQRTNTILWVVLGLVLALGVVLIVRKTK